MNTFLVQASEGIETHLTLRQRGTHRLRMLEQNQGFDLLCSFIQGRRWLSVASTEHVAPGYIFPCFLLTQANGVSRSPYFKAIWIRRSIVERLEPEDLLSKK